MKPSVLILGAGGRTDKRVAFKGNDDLGPGSPDIHFGNYDVTTLDMQQPCDVEFDLQLLHDHHLLPFEDNTFDEIHAYEILEHFGTQGDWQGFFREFGEYHRVLKPGGYMCISCPMWDSPWSFGDPGHTRVLPKEVFLFLTEDHYKQLEGGKSTCTDYRNWVEGWWDAIAAEESEHNLHTVLRALKP